MDYELYYFSPAGTCRGVAELLAGAVPGGRLVDLTLPKERAGASIPDEGRLFALIFPVYAERVPKLLRDWLRGLPRWTGPVCLIACYGGATAGNALRSAVRLTEETLGANVVAAAELPGPHAFHCASERLRAEPTWNGEELISFFRAALRKAEQGGGGVEIPRRLAVGGIPPQDLLSRIAVYYPAIDGEKCTNCGACSRACPTGGDHCIRCTACVRTCPTGARRLIFRLPIPAWYLEQKMKRGKPPRFIL